MEKFAEVRPEKIRFEGPAGQPLFVEVEIIPRVGFPFEIRQLKAQNGKFIKYELIRRCSDGKDRCAIRVENTRKDKGRYFDALFVLTDSPIRPKIPIYIVGKIK